MAPMNINLHGPIINACKPNWRKNIWNFLVGSFLGALAISAAGAIIYELVKVAEVVIKRYGKDAAIIIFIVILGSILGGIINLVERLDS